jgi:KaiC/GvpD/RAD55 family RecA-like ATPase
MTVKGDIGPLFDALKRSLIEIKFTETSSKWPSYIEMSRGKGGLFAKNIQEIKTVLKVSLKQAPEGVDILLEYNFNVPSSFFEKDNKEINEEFLQIKHSIADIASAAKADTVCDVCLTQIKMGEKFCSNCGRSVARLKTSSTQSASAAMVAVESGNKLDVQFDPTKMPSGYKTVDDVLYGGIPNNSAVVVTSPACEEKDVLLTKFIETGLDQKETVVYISTDNVVLKNLKDVQAQKFYNVICNAQADLMVPAGPTTAKNITKIKGVDRLTELSMALTSLLNIISADANEARPKRLVLSIISDMLLSSQAVNTRKWLTETITKFKVKNFTILAFLNPYMHSKEEAHAIIDLFDGQIDLYEKDVGGIPKICMRVRRLSNSRYSSREVELAKEDLWIQGKSK